MPVNLYSIPNFSFDTHRRWRVRELSEDAADEGVDVAEL